MRLQISQRHLIIRFAANRTKKILAKTFQQFEKRRNLADSFSPRKSLQHCLQIQILQQHKRLLMPKYCPLCKRIA